MAEGLICENCGKAEPWKLVQRMMPEMQRMMQGEQEVKSVPDGWVRTSDPKARADSYKVLDFCSWDCVEQFSTGFRLMRQVEQNQPVEPNRGRHQFPKAGS